MEAVRWARGEEPQPKNILFVTIQCDAQAHIIFISYSVHHLLLVRTKTLWNDFNGQRPEVFFRFKNLHNIFSHNTHDGEDSIKKIKKERKKNMKYVNESIHHCIASVRCGTEPNRAREEKHTLHLYNYISISIYSVHYTHSHSVEPFGFGKVEKSLEKQSRINNNKNQLKYNSSTAIPRVFVWKT